LSQSSESLKSKIKVLATLGPSESSEAEVLLCLSCSFCLGPAIHGTPWLTDALLHLTPSLQGMPTVSLSPHNHTLVRTPVLESKVLSLDKHDFILMLEYICTKLRISTNTLESIQCNP
jgi:hypothetical protein